VVAATGVACCRNRLAVLIGTASTAPQSQSGKQSSHHVSPLAMLGQ